MRQFLKGSQKRRRYWCGLALATALVIGTWYGSRAIAHNRARKQVLAGMKHLHSGDLRQAEIEFLAASHLAPDEPVVRRSLGQLRLSQGRLAEARSALRWLADRHPSEPHSLCELAEAELRSRDPSLIDAAVDDGVLAAGLEPDCLRAQRVAGEALIAKGDTRRGIDYLRRASELSPDNLGLSLAVHQQLLGAQRLNEATALAEELTRRFPTEAQALAVLGLSYQLHPPQTAEARKAPQVLGQALRLDPQNLVALAQLGHHHVLQNDGPAAIRYLEKARSLVPSRRSVIFDLSRAYRLAGRHAEATAALREFTRMSERATEIARLERRRLVAPDDPELQRRLAELHAVDGTAPQAPRDNAVSEAELPGRH